MSKKIKLLSKKYYSCGEPFVILNALRSEYDLYSFFVDEVSLPLNDVFIISCESDISDEFLNGMRNFSNGILYMLTEYDKE